MMTQLFEPKWHVVYTLPKAERKVLTLATAMGIESYLPLHKVVRQWSDRKKKLEVPLFPNYVFVKVDTPLRVHLYSIREVVRFVSIEKKPVVVKEEEIVTIKKILSEDLEILKEEYYQHGMLVRIQYGQFAGLEGIIVNKYGNSRLLIRVNGLMKAYSFNISSDLVTAVNVENLAFSA